VTHLRTAPLLALAGIFAALPLAAQRATEGPRTYTARPTAAAIRPADAMSRLYVLADDSMKGRESGRPGNVMATDFIAAELRRAGLEPMGENGTFFQSIPLVTKGLGPGAALSVDGAPLALWTDWAPLPTTENVFPFGPALSATGAQVVFGGRIGGEMVPAEQARGKVVVLLPPLGADGKAEFRFWSAQRTNPYPGAAAVAIASLDASPEGILEYIREERTELSPGTPAATAPGSAGFLVSAAAAERLLGAAPAGLRPGAAGRAVSGAFSFGERPAAAPARNVIAVLRGSDPALRGQYVVISAHNDHVGTTAEPLDHDSVRAFNRVMRPQGANDRPGEPTPEQAARIRALADSMRQAHGGARLDSVFNGADDDGSGTVALLEIAEAMAAAPRRPRRSILFMSHTAEEAGLYGSQHFTDHPTVPRDSIVAALNMDMVGRGRAEDIRGGGPNYIQLIGSRRLSTQLGATIDSLNARRPERMEIDYSFDAPRHPLNRYCRSDHFMYARYGIPITYFSRGYHVDYHQVGDEPQYIDYEGLTRVAGFVRDIAFAVADRPQRLVVDGPRQDPNAPCRQ
jgi:hypothetical protein